MLETSRNLEQARNLTAGRSLFCFRPGGPFLQTVCLLRPQLPAASRLRTRKRFPTASFGLVNLQRGCALGEHSVGKDRQASMYSPPSRNPLLGFSLNMGISV